MESCRLGWQRHFFHAFSGAMVCHRKKEAGGGATGVLVAKSGGCLDTAVLFDSPERFRLHFCLRLHLDSIQPQHHDTSSAQGGAINVRGLRAKKSAADELLSRS